MRVPLPHLYTVCQLSSIPLPLTDYLSQTPSLISPSSTPSSLPAGLHAHTHKAQCTHAIGAHLSLFLITSLSHTHTHSFKCPANDRLTLNQR